MAEINSMPTDVLDNSKQAVVTSFTQAYNQIIEVTPKIVAMVVVLVVGYVLARLAARAITLLCEKIGLQVAAERSGRGRGRAAGHRRAGVPHRDHHRKGQATTADDPEQRANNAHEGQRFLADLEVGSVRMTPSGIRSNPYPADSAGAILIARERRYRCR